MKQSILSLAPNVLNQEENTVVCIARRLSSNGRLSAYFKVLSYSMWSKYLNSKSISIMSSHEHYFSATYKPEAGTSFARSEEKEAYFEEFL